MGIEPCGFAARLQNIRHGLIYGMAAAMTQFPAVGRDGGGALISREMSFSIEQYEHSYYLLTRGGMSAVFLQCRARMCAGMAKPDSIAASATVFSPTAAARISAALSRDIRLATRRESPSAIELIVRAP